MSCKTVFYQVGSGKRARTCIHSMHGQSDSINSMHGQSDSIHSMIL